MAYSNRPASSRIRLGVLTIAPIPVLAYLFLVFPPDGVDRSTAAQFVGRFHLLTVHFPIALILLVPLMELAGRNDRRPHLRTSVDFVLALAMFSSLAAAVLGWCLARSSGYSGRLVTQHMWGGLAVAAACWVCWMVRANSAGPRLSIIYILGLVATVGLVSWTGYRGGQLSQGENHLTEHMPAVLRTLIGISSESKPVAPIGQTTYYSAHVEPILASNCYSCHGAEKQKGKLRLDSFEAMMRGGEDGAVIKAGDAKGSDLFHRIMLPPSDDNAMPPSGKRALSASEVKIIELWIAAGASATVAADGIKGAPVNDAPVAEATFAEVDPAIVERGRGPLAASVAQLQSRYPGILNYESRNSANLVVNASLMGTKFGDDDVAALTPLSGQLVSVDFSGTGVTDRSAANLAAMKEIQTIRLLNTKITDSTVLLLGGLDQLESLNVYGTSVTPACLKVMEQLPKLQHFYVGATTIKAGAPVSEVSRGKLQF